jgi:ubiquitin carboxyl-terminal hydrolase 34
MDGTPTNVAEQKDAQEFLNVLFDRLENSLKPTPKKYLLQSVFMGKTVSQLIFPCGRVQNRVEDFYNLSLPVKDFNNVYESLDKQIEGEEISDFFDEVA